MDTKTEDDQMYLETERIYLREYMDLRSRLGINPINYMMVGAANLTFFLLLLSLCEHLSFRSAYTISSLAVILQVTFYAVSILKSVKRALWLSGAMSGFYGYLYFSLQDSENSLLLGTCAIFAMVCIVMFFTRNLKAFTNFEKPVTAPQGSGVSQDIL